MHTPHVIARRIALGFTLALTWHAAVSADTQEEDELALVYGNSPTISVATGSSQPLRRAPAVASVITADDIAAMGASDLDDVLETVPGIHVTRSAIGYAPMYIIRGIGAGGNTNPQVLVLQNGIPLTEVYAGDKGNGWGSMPLTDVERIEIIRGPGSALYGADAFAGVINIITKTANDIHGTEAGTRLGSFDSRDAWIQHGGKHNGVDVAAYLQVGGTKGPNNTIEADAQTLNDQRFGTHVSLAPGPVERADDALDANLELSQGNWRWRSNAKLRDHEGLGAGVNSALDPSNFDKSTRVNSDLAWTDSKLAEHWSAGVLLSYFYYFEGAPNGLELFPPGAKLGPNLFPDGLIGGPSRWQRQLRASGYVLYSGWRGHTWRFGLGHDDLNLYQTETFKNFLLGPAGAPILTGPVIDYNAIQPHILPHRRRIDDEYVQDEWQLAPDWIVTAGVRHDHYDDFGGTTNPRLALVWDASLDVTAKLLYGRAFRAPAFSELYAINPVSQGNPNLRPETIATTEGLLAWQVTRGVNATIGVFSYDMKNLIRIVANPAPAPGDTFVNVGHIKGQGAELEMTWDPTSALRLAANYALESAIDQATMQDPGYAPHRHAYARADWRFDDGYSLSPQLNYVADRHRAAGDARAPIPDYKTVDLALSNQRGNWGVNAAVHNLFNADAREPSLAPGLALPFDLPLPTRAIALQLTHKM